MAASIECCIDVFSDENGPILPVSEKTLQTIKRNQEKWRQLDGVEREVGVNAQFSDVQPGPLCTAGFHTPCYRRFTDKTKIARSVIRCANVGQQTSLSLTILWKLVMTSGGSYYLLLRTLYICLQKRRKTMPKHVALGLTMRHMTGSSSLIGI